MQQRSILIAVLVLIILLNLIDIMALVTFVGGITALGMFTGGSSEPPPILLLFALLVVAVTIVVPEVLIISMLRASAKARAVPFKITISLILAALPALLMVVRMYNITLPPDMPIAPPKQPLSLLVITRYPQS